MNEGPLAKQALVDATANRERIKEIVEILDLGPDKAPEGTDGEALFQELKSLVGIEPKPEEVEDDELEDQKPFSEVEAEKEPQSNASGTVPGGLTQTHEAPVDTVESLVENNTKEELVCLAEKEDVNIVPSENKAEIAKAILAARAAKLKE